MFFRSSCFPAGTQRDIPALAAHFIRDFDQKAGKKVTGISDKALIALMAYTLAGERTGAGEYDRTECAVGKGNDL